MSELLCLLYHARPNSKHTKSKNYRLTQCLKIIIMEGTYDHDPLRLLRQHGDDGVDGHGQRDGRCDGDDDQRYPPARLLIREDLDRDGRGHCYSDQRY